MAQQVNLCLPVLRQQTPRFAAQTLAMAALVILSVAGTLAAAWIYNLSQATAALKVNLDAQTKELEALRVAIEQRNKSAAPAEQALQQEIKTRRATLQQRDSVLAALSQGLFEPGQGHAARLQLVAQSIPSVVWVTQIKADEQHLEVGGYTLEPAALNQWVRQLAASPLLRGQALSTIQVESVKPESVVLPAAGEPLPVAAKSQAGAAAVASASPVSLPPMWSFSLLSNVRPVSVPVAGAKP